MSQLMSYQVLVAEVGVSPSCFILRCTLSSRLPMGTDELGWGDFAEKDLNHEVHGGHEAGGGDANTAVILSTRTAGGLIMNCDFREKHGKRTGARRL